MWNIFKKRRNILIIGAIIIVLIIFISLSGGEKVEYVTAEVVRGELTQTVSEVGMIKSSQEIELNFLQSGNIGKLLVEIGDKVKKDDILAELDYNSLTIRAQEAQANLDIAQANLNKMLSGATSQTIAVSQAQVNKAKAAYLSALDELDKVQKTTSENKLQAEKNLADLESDSTETITPYEQAVITATNSLSNKKSTYQQSIDNKLNTVLITIHDKLAVANTALDKINTILTDTDTDNLLSVKNDAYLNYTNNSYDISLNLLVVANTSLSLAKANPTDVNTDKIILDSLASLNKVFESLDYCYGALENSLTSSDFSQSELDAYKTSISAQSTLISAAILAVQTAEHNWEDAVLAYSTNISTAEDALTKARVDLADAKQTAKDNLASTLLSSDQQLSISQAKVDTNLELWQISKAQLAEVKSPARTQDVALTRAQVKQAEAALNLVKQQIEDSIIKAPIDCTVVKIEYDIGEQVMSTKPAISVLGENNFEIEIDISEADIAKIKSDNLVEITLDAFGEDLKFMGEVYFIEPAETVIQDVIYYKVKIRFDDTEEKMANIKSGMTANAIITTAKKDNVLIAPSRAIIQKNGDGKYIRILVGRKLVEVPVTVGLRGDGGMVEILSGAKEGDEVITFIKESK